MSYAEFVSWCKYRNKWGGLHTGMRIDRAVGRGLATIVGMHARKSNLSYVDFSPYDRQEKQTRMTDPQAMFSTLKAIAKRGR